jgi:hypothetical protein
MSSSSPAGFAENLHPRASGSIFSKKPDIPSSLPWIKAFFFCFLLENNHEGETIMNEVETL